MWFSISIFSVCNCFPTKDVICLICEYLVQLLISKNRGGRGQRVKMGPGQVSQPGESEHAQMAGNWTGEGQCQWVPPLSAGENQRPPLEQRSGAEQRKWEQETHEGPSSYSGLVFIIWLKNNRRQEWAWRENRRAFQMPANREDGALSVLSTDVSGTYYSMLLCQEKLECAYTPTFSPPTITPGPCHLLFLRQKFESPI